jgi:hypothetical protein
VTAASIKVDVAVLAPSPTGADQIAAFIGSPAFSDPSSASVLLEVHVEERPVVQGTVTVLVGLNGTFEALSEPSQDPQVDSRRPLYIGAAAGGAVAVLIGSCLMTRCRRRRGGVERMVLKKHNFRRSPSGSPRDGGTNRTPARTNGTTLSNTRV